ncbi:uncharacterized protein LOC127719305 [Mytilus californianus]|uniref:uncharacterized protein LOC127719305 n=1 Tax=Mytilus californianus TaxID=6549 RepID=UPI002246E898|nr:uncharacterized protein LOC127719305 [Mytilus californianus]
MSLDGQLRQLIISDPQKKAPPAVAPKPKVQNSSPKPFRPGGSTYRQFRRTEDVLPPPPQTAYVEEQNFPPLPPDTGRGYGYQEEQPIYAKPNIRGSSSDMYNRPSSNSPSYMTGSPDQYQYQRQNEPSPPVHGGSPNQFYGRQNSGERSPIIYSITVVGKEHVSLVDESTRPVPGPQVPDSAISMQGTSKNKEAEVDALTSLLMENMSLSADPEFMGLYTET